MKIEKYIIKMALASLIMLAVTSCKKAKEPNSSEEPDHNTLKKEALSEIASNVIYSTYTDMNLKAHDLYTAVVTLSNTTNATNLSAAQHAWREVRAAWEQSEGFLFGPVSIDNIDPRIDTWPIDFARLDSVLASASTFTTSYVDNLEEALKGFHPIEYLLFGTDGNKSATAFTIREKEYLIALTANLEALCTQIKASWDPNIAGNYSMHFNTAGNGSIVYQTQRAAYEEIIDAMIGISDEVANGKMAEPLDNQNPALEESPFANNSLTDFTNNIRSIQNIYYGKYINDGKGMEDLIKATNLSMDGMIKTKINNSLVALGNITVPFSQAITTQQPQVQNAITAINDLKSYLELTVKPYLQTLTN